MPPPLPPPLPHPRGGRAARMKQGRSHAPPPSPPFPIPPVTRCGGCGADVGTPILVVPRASTWWWCCPRETRSLSCPPPPFPLPIPVIVVLPA